MILPFPLEIPGVASTFRPTLAPATFDGDALNANVVAGQPAPGIGPWASMTIPVAPFTALIVAPTVAVFASPDYPSYTLPRSVLDSRIYWKTMSC